MVFGAKNEKGEKYYTDLVRVFEAINNKQMNYNWLITDCECYPEDAEIAEMLNRKYCWLSGEELTTLVTKDRFQWIWAVLSGFEKSTELSEVLKYDLPACKDNYALWKTPVTMQHPLAQIEIVPFDSSCTLLFSRNEEIVDAFRNYFQFSEKLEEYMDKR